MASIEVDPDQVSELGRELLRVAARAEQVSQPLGNGCIVARQPPHTASALASLVTEWQAAARNLEGELTSLGQDALAAGFLYSETERDVIPVTPP